MSDDPFFVMRSGEIWACWLNGKPAVNLGAEKKFWAAAEELYGEIYGSKEPINPAIANEAQVARSPIDRVGERHLVTIFGRLFTTRRSFSVTIFDLSESGCRISESGIAKMGEHVSIKIGTIGPIPATIRWKSEADSGLKFDTPLHTSVLTHVVNQFTLR